MFWGEKEYFSPHNPLLTTGDFMVNSRIMNVNTDLGKIEELLSRGTEDIFVYDELKALLLSGRPLRVKLGIDPTGPNLHLGRAVVLRKLKAFQDLGHTIVLIIGDFTAQIGDASDKSEKRPMLTREAVNENFKNYREQIATILDISKIEFQYNSDWLSKLGFQEISELAECFSVQQMSSRRNFKDRLDRGDEVSLREFLYPLMQGYDSVAVKSNVEIGGFDQLFNLKAGRTIQRRFGLPEQSVLTVQMLEGTDGRKMSTSWGNIITIVDEPNDMYGKVMAIHDDLIVKYFVLATDVVMSEIESFKQDMEAGTNPRDIKMRLAREIVTLYHGEDSARIAEENFVSVFQKGNTPEEMEELHARKGSLLSEVLVKEKIVASKSDFRRLVEGGGITRLSDDMVIDTAYYSIDAPDSFKIGKKRFVKIFLK